MCGAQRVIMLNQHYLGTHACVMRLEIASKSMEKCGVGMATCYCSLFDVCHLIILKETYLLSLRAKHNMEFGWGNNVKNG